MSAAPTRPHGPIELILISSDEEEQGDEESESETDEEEGSPPPVAASAPVALTSRAREYADHSISETTRRTYQSSINRFTAYRGSQLASTVTNEEAANYLAHLADGKSLASVSILGAKAALRWWWRSEQGFPNNADQDDPFSSAVAAAVAKGISKSFLPAEIRAREAAPSKPAIGMRELRVEALRRLLDPDKVERCLGLRDPVTWARYAIIWAATTLGAAALLRASEFLGGSSKHHGDRILLANQIRFHLPAATPSAHAGPLIVHEIAVPRVGQKDRCEEGGLLSYAIHSGGTRAPEDEDAAEASRDQVGRGGSRRDQALLSVLPSRRSERAYRGRNAGGRHTRCRSLGYGRRGDADQIRHRGGASRPS